MSSKKVVLVLGGAGFIGSHCAISLLDAGYHVVIIDNLSNSSEKSVERVQQITGKTVDFHNVDITNVAAFDAVVSSYSGKIHSAILLAGLKAVGESVREPLRYYGENINIAINVMNVLPKYGCKRVVFSSSATVYGAPKVFPISETAATGPLNPYGRTKLFIEHILQDVCVSDPEWSVVLLRYFNPCGAHPSGLIGEDPDGIPNNLMPYLAQVAIGKLKELTVFGKDYDTVDGTGMRDYIHIMDLAEGHVSAIKRTETLKGSRIYNLGTGQGYTVLQMIEAMQRAVGHPLAYKIGDRREGDTDKLLADPSLAKNELEWDAKLGLDEMCRDLWNWQTKNPKGYNT